MARLREFNTETVLQKAMEVFWRCGFKRTSFALLEKKTGVKKASLCAAYGNKEALFLKALEHYHQLLCLNLAFLCEHPASPKKALNHLLTQAGGLKSHAGKHKGCMMVNTVIELSTSDPQCNKIVSAHRDKMKEILTKLLKCGIEAGEFRSTLQPSSGAEYLLLIITGLQTLARTPGSASQKRKEGRDVCKLALLALE